jgi:hypothetical protein
MAMKAPKLACAFLWFLAFLTVLAAFAVLDWYPIVKELSYLRRERGDLERKIKNYVIMASNFVFPDKEEEKHFRNTGGDFSRGLFQVEDDATWSRWWLSWLRWQAKKDKLAGALLLFSAGPDGAVSPGVRLSGQGPAADWLAAQLPEIQEGFHEASPGRFPWKSLFFNPRVPLSKPLASRPLALVLAAPLPALLNFINHCSWYMRLEIVRLRLEPGPGLSRAWLVCRSSFLIREPSPWAVKVEPGSAGDDLLIDPDSPLLWQKVDPSIAYRVEKKELTPLTGRGRPNRGNGSRSNRDAIE